MAFETFSFILKEYLQYWNRGFGPNIPQEALLHIRICKTNRFLMTVSIVVLLKAIQSTEASGVLKAAMEQKLFNNAKNHSIEE